MRLFLTCLGLICYSMSGGEAVFRSPFCVEYKLEKKGFGDLLLLARLYLQLLSENECNTVTVLNDFKHESIDGELVGDSCLLKTGPVSVSWHSTEGVKKESHYEIVSVLLSDVDGLNSSATTSSSYFYGKLIARATRLALIVDEGCFLDVIPKVRKYLKEIIEPWLDGTFKENAFLYDQKWGGIVTKQGYAADSGSDFGSESYSSQLHHLGSESYKKVK